MLKSLHPVSEIYKTDKGKSGFSYIYEELFREQKEEIESLLEIGVNNGGSVKLFRDYFQNAIVYGIDVNSKALRAASERIKISIVDQSDKLALEEFAKGKCFNILIDDGSHVVSHQILSFKTLWPYISKGGYYIIEDTETSYWKDSKHGYVDQDLTTIEFFKSMIDELNFHGKKNVAKIDFKLYRRTVAYINFYPNLIVVKKNL